MKKGFIINAEGGKKWFLWLVIVGVLGFTIYHINSGDLWPDRSEEPETIAPLTFVVPQDLLEQGITPDTDERMEAIRQIVAEDPYWGRPGALGFRHVLTSGDLDGADQVEVLFLVVNRTGDALQGVSFDLTFKLGDVYILEAEPVELRAAVMGILPEHAAVPLILRIPVQAFAGLTDLAGEESYVSVENLVIEPVG